MNPGSSEGIGEVNWPLIGVRSAVAGSPSWSTSTRMNGAVLVWGLTTDARFMMSLKRTRTRLPLQTLVTSVPLLIETLRSRIGVPKASSPVLTSAVMNTEGEPGTGSTMPSEVRMVHWRRLWLTRPSVLVMYGGGSFWASPETVTW